MVDKINILKMGAEDVDEMAPIMKRAFDEDTRRHLGMEAGGPPGYDNGDFIRKWYFYPNAEAFKIVRGEQIIGGFNVFVNKETNENFLGNIFIDPDYEDQGLGTFIWRSIEKHYPNTVKWRTETPGFSKRNHNFYVNKCGFHIIRIDNPKDEQEASFIMEKVMK